MIILVLLGILGVITTILPNNVFCSLIDIVFILFTFLPIIVLATPPDEPSVNKSNNFLFNINTKISYEFLFYSI